MSAIHHQDDTGCVGEPILDGKCCLVVEDNPFALDIMNVFLQRQGFRVDGAENGQIALDKYLAAPEKYCGIFMDLQMPVMSGYEAARNIRNSGCTGSIALPIVAMSGDPLDNLLELGFSHCLRKPFVLQDILPLLYAF